MPNDAIDALLATLPSEYHTVELSLAGGDRC
jgi:hypothetical protein